MKRVLTNVPSLGLLDEMKPFFPYVHEKSGLVGIMLGF
jgi:hypothetical protein